MYLKVFIFSKILLLEIRIGSVTEILAFVFLLSGFTVSAAKAPEAIAVVVSIHTA
jgi:hypothetical protein